MLPEIFLFTFIAKISVSAFASSITLADESDYSTSILVLQSHKKFKGTKSEIKYTSIFQAPYLLSYFCSLIKEFHELVADILFIFSNFPISSTSI